MMKAHKTLAVSLELRPLTSGMVMEWQKAMQAVPPDTPKHGYANHVLKAALQAGWVSVPPLSAEAVDSMPANVVEWMAQEIRAHHKAETDVPPE